MKTVITIENNPIGGSKVTVQVDDDQPVQVQSTLEPIPTLAEVLDTPSKQTETPTASYSRAPKEPVAKRNCLVCGDSIAALSKQRKLCLKPECAKERAQQYNAKYASKAEKPTKVVDTKPEPKPVAAQSDRFNDPWNCEACRTGGCLCGLHQSMTDDGSVPPFFSRGTLI